MLGPWYSVRVSIQYSVITFRATSMAATNIDAIKKQKKAEYDRQYAKKINVNITSTFNDRSTGSYICLRLHLSMSHVKYNRYA